MLCPQNSSSRLFLMSTRTEFSLADIALAKFSPFKHHCCPHHIELARFLDPREIWIRNPMEFAESIKIPLIFYGEYESLKTTNKRFISQVNEC